MPKRSRKSTKRSRAFARQSFPSTTVLAAEEALAEVMRTKKKPTMNCKRLCRCRELYSASGVVVCGASKLACNVADSAHITCLDFVRAILGLQHFCFICNHWHKPFVAPSHCTE